LIPLTHKRTFHPLSILGTGISIKCGGAKIVYGPKGDISITIPTQMQGLL